MGSYKSSLDLDVNRNWRKIAITITIIQKGYMYFNVNAMRIENMEKKYQNMSRCINKWEKE